MTRGNSVRSVPPVSATTCSTRGGNFSAGCRRSGRSDDDAACGRHAEDATRRTAEPGGRTHRSDAVAIPAARAEDAAALQQFLDIEEVFGVLAQHEGWRQAVSREFEDIAESGLEATLLGYIFGVGHNSNGDLASGSGAGEYSSSGARLSERVSGTFILDEVCAPESAVPDVVDEAVAFVSLY